MNRSIQSITPVILLIFGMSTSSIAQIKINDLVDTSLNSIVQNEKKTFIQLDPFKILKFDQQQNNTSILRVKKYDPLSLPLFCKLEHQMWSSSKMNVRIRLGSLEYVDRLEGKY